MFNVSLQCCPHVGQYCDDGSHAGLTESMSVNLAVYAECATANSTEPLGEETAIRKPASIPAIKQIVISKMSM
jgi:hypothetical protein